MDEYQLVSSIRLPSEERIEASGHVQPTMHIPSPQSSSQSLIAGSDLPTTLRSNYRLFRQLNSSKESKNTSEDQLKKCPEKGFLPYRMSFSWISPLISLGRQRTIQTEDVYDLPESMKCDKGFEKLLLAWNDEDLRRLSGNKRLAWALWRAFYYDFHLPMIIYKAVTFVLNFSKPLFLSLLLDSLSKDNMHMPYVYASALVVSSTTQSMLTHWYYWYGVQSALTVRNSLLLMIQRQMLSMKTTSLSAFSEGVIMNLCTVDCDNLMSFCWNAIHETWNSPLSILVCIIWLWWLLGVSALVGCATLAMLVFISAGWLSKLKATAQEKMMRLSDKRIDLIGEFIQYMKIIKMSAWEEYFGQRILAIREKQNKFVLRLGSLASLTRSIGNIAPMITALVTFSLYVGVFGGTLDAYIVFTALSLINNLKEPMSKLPEASNYLVRSISSIRRLSEFFSISRMSQTTPTPEKSASEQKETSSSDIDFEFHNCDIGWSENASNLVMRNINLTIPRGKLTMIFGKVGEGKSTLLKTMIRETVIHSGKFTHNAPSLAYCCQEVFIQDGATLRENIVFGELFDLEFYLKTIRACALERDFEMLKDGDMSIVGDTTDGIKLSGGQRQRISLARAVYSKKSCIIFDEPLSAVDSRVANWIFHNVIGPNGILSDKTRILVTHRTHFSPLAEHIILISKGSVAFEGNYLDLISKNIELPHKQEKNEEVEEATDEPVPDSNSIKKSNSTDAISQRPSWLKEKHKQNFKIELKKIPKLVYLRYFLSSTGVLGWIFVVLLVGTSQAFIVESDLFLASWCAEMGTTPTSSQLFYIIVYCVLVVGSGLLYWSRSQLITRAMSNASIQLHDAELMGLISTFVSFVDTCSFGVILGRFSRDVDLIDQDLPNSVQDVFSCAAATIGTLVIVIILTPESTPLLFLIILLFFFIQSRYLPASNCMKKLESMTRYPIFSFMRQSFIGSETIKAFDSIESSKGSLTHRNRIEADLMEHIDTNNRCYFYSFALNRWLGVRVEVVGALIVLVSSVGSLLYRDLTTPTSERSTVSVWLALSITSTLSISGNMNWLVRQISDFEVQMNAVERISEFVDLPSEESVLQEEFSAVEMKKAVHRYFSVKAISETFLENIKRRWRNTTRLVTKRHNRAFNNIEVVEVKEWPKTGNIQASKLSLRYAENMPLVLRNVTFDIKSGEKIGIVGRTGAGKSTLTHAFFRLLNLETEYSSPPLFIDGEDIRQLRLRTLRKSLGIIPQESVLFSETLRFNLDPGFWYQDYEIWKALKLVGLDSSLKLSRGLETRLGDEQTAPNEERLVLSAGQKQLLCVARMLLRKPRILIMDEATAFLDGYTHESVSNLIRDQFNDSTILTIAHRLDSIQQSDRIMVFDAGSLVEMDTPRALASNERSYFSQLLAHERRSNAHSTTVSK